MYSTLLVFSLLNSVTSKQQSVMKFEKCSIIEPFSLDACDQVKGGFSKRTYEPCKNSKVCQKQFNISFVNIEPYTTKFLKGLLKYHVINNCCGNCRNATTVNYFQNMSEVNQESIDSSHMVYPILGRTDSYKLYGYYFVPMIYVPSVYYITAKEDEVMKHFASAYWELWPLFIVGLCMTIIAGFFAWVMETWNNVENFPREFLIGWFEGFWWSFISITTVGYGDIIPKSIMARIFAVFWILIGITLFSMLTASLTTAIRDASANNPNVAGRHIASLQYRAFDAYSVAQHGGILVEVKEQNFTDAIIKMVRMLKRKQIDGFLLDQYTYIHVALLLKTFIKRNVSGEARKMADYFVKKTIRMEKNYVGNELSYGVIMKHREDYHYFSDYILDNRHVIATCKKLRLNQLLGKFDNPKTTLFCHTSRNFIYTVIVVTSVIAMIGCGGLVYELYRTKFWMAIPYRKHIDKE